MLCRLALYKGVCRGLGVVFLHIFVSSINNHPQYKWKRGRSDTTVRIEKKKQNHQDPYGMTPTVPNEALGVIHLFSFSTGNIVLGRIWIDWAICCCDTKHYTSTQSRRVVQVVVKRMGNGSGSGSSRVGVTFYVTCEQDKIPYPLCWSTTYSISQHTCRSRCIEKRNEKEPQQQQHQQRRRWWHNWIISMSIVIVIVVVAVIIIIIIIVVYCSSASSRKWVTARYYVTVVQSRPSLLLALFSLPHTHTHIYSRWIVEE